MYINNDPHSQNLQFYQNKPFFRSHDPENQSWKYKKSGCGFDYLIFTYSSSVH